jgi:CheY-like chemotaxis protein
VIRVLHIDDEAPIRLLSRVNLEAEGMEVIEAANGDTGMRLAKREQPNVILLNVNLPGLDGFEVAENLLRDQETSAIPIVFLTARSAFRDRCRALEIGAVDYITKPFNPLELAPRLRGLLRLLERGEGDELRRETISDLPPLAVLARALRAQVAQRPGIAAEAPPPITRRADAVAEMQRVAERLEWRRPLLSTYVACELLGHVWMTRLPAPRIDLEQERAVDQAAEELRADASEAEFGGIDDGTRNFLRELAADERRKIREKLAALILAIADYVFDHLTEEAKGRSLVRLVTVLYVLLALYNAVTRAIDGIESDDEHTDT